MSDAVTVRSATEDDADRIREVVGDSMRASYARSPDDLDALRAAAFGDGRQASAREADEASIRVATVDGELAGVVRAGLEEGTGYVRHLHVDPAHRGLGVGTALFEDAVGALRDEGAEAVRGLALEAGAEAGSFLESMGFGRSPSGRGGWTA